MARHRRNRKLQRRLLTSVPSRRLILENLEDRRLLAVTVADFNNRWLPGLRAELGAAVEESAQLKISLPGVGQTLGALYDVAAHIETARAVALDVQSDGSIQNGDPLAPFLVALDARPEFDVDNVSLPGPNYAAFDLTINLNTAATSQNTTITLPDNLDGLDIKLGSPKITLENRLQIVVRVVIDEVGFVDPAKQLRYENPVSDAARAIYTPLIASPQLNLDGVIAGSLDFDATLKVQLNGGYDFAFGEPTDTPLADLTINTATGSPQLSFDFLGTLDATGPLPQLFYQKEFRYNIPTGAAVNTPQFGGVVVGGTRYDLATPQGRAEVIKKVGGPVLQKIADVIPDPVSKLLLGTVALPGFGITLEELLLGNRPIDFLQAAGVPTFVVTALEKILEIDSFYNQVTGANAGNVGSVQSAAADLGLSFPILTNPTDKILQIFNGKNVDLATYSMDFVQLAIDQFGGMPPPGIITLQPDALGGAATSHLRPDGIRFG